MSNYLSSQLVKTYKIIFNAYFPEKFIKKTNM